MGVELIFRIAGIGLVVAIVVTVLKQSGRDEVATLVALTGLILVLILVIDELVTLFDSVRRLFSLY
ncbi:MAG: stage III sporulation protein AC [Christensenellales bacterium]